MASVTSYDSSGSPSARMTLNASCSASRNGSTVTISCPWSCTGYGTGGSCYVGGSEVYSKSSGSSSIYADFNGSGTKTLSYGNQYGARTFTIKIEAGVRAGGSPLKWSSTTMTCSIGAQTFTVSFNPGQGTTPTESKTVSYGSTYGELPTPVRSGYAFTGWFTAEDGGSQITADSTVGITSNQILYAHWEAMTIVRIVENGEVRTVTKVYAVQSGNVKHVLSIFVVKDGTVKQAT